MPASSGWSAGVARMLFEGDMPRERAKVPGSESGRPPGRPGFFWVRRPPRRWSANLPRGPVSPTSRQIFRPAPSSSSPRSGDRGEPCIPSPTSARNWTPGPPSHRRPDPRRLPRRDGQESNGQKWRDLARLQLQFVAPTSTRRLLRASSSRCWGSRASRKGCRAVEREVCLIWGADEPWTRI